MTPSGPLGAPNSHLQQLTFEETMELIQKFSIKPCKIVFHPHSEWEDSVNPAVDVMK
jgi:hypothetical protein